MEKSGKLYYSIAEVAEMAAVKAHVLRYWETEFPSLRPKKNRAGNRTYRERDVKLVLLIKRLLYDEGFTIRGALKRLREKKNEEIEQIEIPFIPVSSLLQATSATIPAPAAPPPVAPISSAPIRAMPLRSVSAGPAIAAFAKAKSGSADGPGAITEVRRELESILADLSA